jgi:hypothetical protein
VSLSFTPKEVGVAIAFVFESDEVNQEQYDGLMEALGRTEVRSELPPGVIAHIAGPKGAGWRVVDVWEDPESARRFYESERFQSIVGSAPGMAIQDWPLHRIEVARTVARID